MVDKRGRHALSQGAMVIGNYALDNGPIFIVNNVIYIMPLERGWSLQAPNGMALQAIAAGAQVVRGTQLLGK